MIRYSRFPEIERGPHAVQLVINEAIREGRVGCDIEFSPISGPTIIGVASRNRAAVADWRRDLGEAVFHAGVPISAYAGIGADKPVMEKALGTTTPLSLWEDPMIKHWIVHPDLASVPKSAYGEDRDDSHVMGMMNIWIATSLLHDLPRWKGCLAEIDSDGNARQAGLAELCVARKRVCPIHDERGYCAIDAWTGLVDDYALDDQMAALSIPRSWYEFRRAVAYYCWRMQYDFNSGIDVDLEAAEALDYAIKSKKAALFPARLDYSGKTRQKKVTTWVAQYEDGSTQDVEKKGQALKVNAAGLKRIKLDKCETLETVPGKLLTKPRVIWEGPFNPNSPGAVLQWFSDQGIHLRDRVGKPTMGKQVLLAEVARRLRPHGLKLDPETGVLSSEVGDDSEMIELPEPVDLLVRLAQKTLLGKGLASWVDLKYLENTRLRSRFNSCGTSTTRLSSSKCNLQNVPARGFGREVRKLFTARKGYVLVKADASQLEFRMCLWHAGVDHDFTNDIFQELADTSEGKFDSAAARNNMKARDISKSVVHACVTGDHEVLTKSGWIRIDRWSGQEIANWDTSGRIKFETPVAYHQYAFSGDLECIEGRAISAAVTSDHTFPVSVSGTDGGKSYQKWHKVTVANMPISGRIPVAGNGNGVFWCSEEEIRKVVAVQADAATEPWSRGKATFHFVKERKKRRLEQLFGPIDWKPCNCHPGRGHKGTINFRSNLLDEKKDFSPKFFLLAPELRQAFLDELVYWDGSVKNKCGASYYYTTSKWNAEVVQTVAHLTNRECLSRCLYEEGKKPFYKLSFNKRVYATVKSQKYSKEAYTGNVYCFTTSTKYFMLRRNGKIFVSGNCDYFEGLKLLTPHELSSARCLADRGAGALIVYDGRDLPLWTFRGRIVCSTCSNLAERLFGDRTRLSRAKAHEIQNVFLNRYPKIRRWQQRVCREIEESREVRLPPGHRVPLYGRLPEDDIKFALAVKGQGGGAVYIQEGMLLFDVLGRIANLQVHDELVFTAHLPIGTPDEAILDFMRPLVQVSKLLPGFSCPAKVSAGSNWKDTREIGTIRCSDL